MGLCRESPENPAVSSATPTPTSFYSQKLMGIYLPHAGTLGITGWPGAGSSHYLGIPPNLYPPHMSVGLPIPPLLLLLLHATHISSPPTPCLLASHSVSASPPLLPVWMNVASLNHHCQTSIQFNFLIVRVSFVLRFSCNSF